MQNKYMIFKWMLIMSIIIFTGCANEQGQTEITYYELKPSLIKQKLPIIDLVIQEDKMFILNNEQVIIEDSNESKVIRENAIGANDIAVKGNLVAIASNKLEVYNIETKELVQIPAYNEYGLDNIIIRDNEIWALAYLASEEKKQIVRYSLQEKVWKDIEKIEPNKMILSFDLNDKNELLMLYVDLNNPFLSMNLDIMNIKTLDVKQKFQLDEYIEVSEGGDIHYVSAENVVYVNTGHQIYKLELKSGKVTPVLFEDTEKIIEKLVITPNGIKACIKNEQEEKHNNFDEISLYEIAAKEVVPNEQLVMLTYDKQDDIEFSSETQMLRDKYSSLRCSSLLIGEYTDYAEKLKTKLLAKDKDFDIFMVPLEDLPNLNSEYIEDLSEVVDNKDLFKGISDAMYKDSKMIGVPNHIQVESLRTNSRYRDEIKITVEDSLNWTVEDFLELSKKYAKDTDGDGQIDRWFSNLTNDILITNLVLIYDIQNKDRTDDIYSDETFKSLVAKVQEYTENNWIMTKEESEKNKDATMLVYSVSIDLATPHYKEGTEVSENNTMYLALPIISSKMPIYPIYCGSIYCVNMYSSKKEIAKELLSTSIRPEVYIPEHFTTIYSHAEWYEQYYEAYLKAHKEIESRIQNGTRFKMTDTYYELLNHIYTNCQSSNIKYYLLDNKTSIVDQLVNGQVTEEQFVVQVNRLRKMSRK